MEIHDQQDNQCTTTTADELLRGLSFIAERKQNQMILLPRDTDQTIQEKIQLFQTKKKFLIKEKTTEQDLEAIRRFIQEILSNSLISPWNY
jgi:hypothetical protein